MINITAELTRMIQILGEYQVIILILVAAASSYSCGWFIGKFARTGSPSPTMRQVVGFVVPLYAPFIAGAFLGLLREGLVISMVSSGGLIALFFFVIRKPKVPK